MGGKLQATTGRRVEVVLSQEESLGDGSFLTRFAAVAEEARVSRPPVEVRRAGVDDLDDLLILWSQSRGELSRSLRSLGALSADQLRPRLQDTLALGEPPALVARLEGRLVGYAVLRLSPVLAVDPVALHIDHLYVTPTFRRRGVARALLLAVTGLAERSGADQVMAGAPLGARDIHRFLARLGFSPLVVRRVTGAATLRRRLTGEGQRRGLDDLLSRRRSLRARAARSGWPTPGWGSGSQQSDPADPGSAPELEPETDAVRRTDPVRSADDLGRLETDPPPRPGPVRARSGPRLDPGDEEGGQGPRAAGAGGAPDERDAVGPGT